MQTLRTIALILVLPCATFLFSMNKEPQNEKIITVTDIIKSENPISINQEKTTIKQFSKLFVKKLIIQSNLDQLTLGSTHKTAKDQINILSTENIFTAYQKTLNMLAGSQEIAQEIENHFNEHDTLVLRKNIIEEIRKSKASDHEDEENELLKTLTRLTSCFSFKPFANLLKQFIASKKDK